MIQDRAIVTMEGEWETAPKLSNWTRLNDFKWPLTQISRSRYYSTSHNSKKVQDSQWRTNRKSYTIYRTAPFSMTLNNPWPSFQGHAILWRWISHKRLNIRPWLLWKANRKPHPSFQMVSVTVTSSDKVTILFNVKLEGHSVERMNLRRGCFDGSLAQWIKPCLKKHSSLQRPIGLRIRRIFPT